MKNYVYCMFTYIVFLRCIIFTEIKNIALMYAMVHESLIVGPLKISSSQSLVCSLAAL